MRILVLSDTHISGPVVKFPKELEDELEKCDYCLHAGDLITYAVYKELSAKIKTYAVAGNMDDTLASTNLPKKQIIELSGFKIGLIHGGGAPNFFEQYIDYHFEKDYQEINIFVFGHTHRPFDQEKKGKIYFNPGSTSDTVGSSEKTYGILEIKDKRIKRSIKKIG